MRDFLGTLAFVAGVAVLAVGLKMSARAVLFDEKLHPIPAIDSLSEAAQILVYGSSHARVGLNPSLFSQPAINLGTNMMDYIVEHRLVEKTLDVVPGLKVAIVELDVMLPARTMARVPNLRGFYILGLTP